jgi:hypothetical protein
VKLVPAYLLRQGQGKAIVIYSRCEDEELCRAELLAMLDDVDGRVPKHLAGGPVHGYYDVDPAYTRAEFMKPYAKDPARRKKLMDAGKSVASGSWNFPVLE